MPLEAEIIADGGTPLSMDISLSTDNTGYAGRIARLWDQYDTLDLRGALDAARSLTETDAAEFEVALENKMVSPLAAAVAASVLLRARRFDRLHDWVRNLADWFPHLPDGAVLWAQQLRQSRNADWEREALAYLLRLETQSLPLLNPTFETALSLADDLLHSERARSDAEARRRLTGVRDRLRHADTFGCAGGLFRVYMAAPGTLSSDLVLPTTAAANHELTLSDS